MCSHVQLPECESTNFSQSPCCPPLFMSHGHPKIVPVAGLCTRRSAITEDKSGLEWEVALVALGGIRWGTAWRENERCRENEKETIGPGSPFNLLINHANEILTDYSEAFLEGGRKTLMLDYTMSMWRAKNRSEIYCWTKWWETFWPTAVKQNHWRHEGNESL